MSTILVDNLTGKTSAGSITVTSEGGAATQSLQQGLAKAWVNFNGTGTIAIRDSLSVSGLVDNAAGNYDVNFSNNMSNDDYSAPTASKFVASYHGLCSISTQTTSELTLFGMTGAPTSAYLGSNYKGDQEIVNCTIHGDLA
jgi:hypothetical protein